MSCPSSNRDRFSRYCLSDFLNLLCVIEDEDNWLSGGNLTHERIPAGFLGSLKSCTIFVVLLSLITRTARLAGKNLILARRWKSGMIGIAVRFDQTANVKSFSGQCWNCCSQRARGIAMSRTNRTNHLKCILWCRGVQGGLGRNNTHVR